MISVSYLQAELDKLRGNKDYTEVLECDRYEPKEGEPSAGKKPKKDFLLDGMSKKSEKILEKPPRNRKNLFTGGQHSVEAYGLSSMEDLSRLVEYLEINGNFHLKHVPKDGTCMWRSMLECIMYSAEYQQVMLRRQLVLCLVQHASFFYKLLIEHIRAQYGPIRLSTSEYKQKKKVGTLTDVEEIDQNLPGPFSFLGYLEYLWKPVSWGDQGVLVAVAMMWQLKITVVTAEKLHQERIQHDGPMAEADMLLIFCGGNHYVLAGKS